jgi:hypothetical protein
VVGMAGVLSHAASSCLNVARCLQAPRGPDTAPFACWTFPHSSVSLLITMSDNSSIEWTEATPRHGCTKVSPGCASLLRRRLLSAFAVFPVMLTSGLRPPAPARAPEPALEWKRPCLIFVN